MTGTTQILTDCEEHKGASSYRDGDRTDEDEQDDRHEERLGYP